MVLRNIANRHGEAGGNGLSQLTGRWVAENVYRNPQRVRSGDVANFNVGDVVSMGNPRAPHHSMVVVDINNGKVLARGFNNAGAFGGPIMGWDPELRDLADDVRWGDGDVLKCNNGPAEIHVIRYNQIEPNIPNANT